MAKQTKGKCKYCGKEYTRGYMIKHLSSCKARTARIAEETGSGSCGYFELVISGRYSSAYWLIIEMRDDATLKELDTFLRDIWLECCGHLSAFEIYGVSYDVAPVENFWGEPAKSMNCKLKSVLEKGMTFTYEYDFGSTTDLVITVQDYRESCRKTEKLTILSRNNPPEILCDECQIKPASLVCYICLDCGEGFLCDECSETHECGDEMMSDICNSPRVGVCGYSGSVKYPDQFEPDVN